MTFEIRPSRANGKTDVELVYQIVENAEPGDRFPYDAIQEVLQVGIDVPIKRSRIHVAVRMANVRLLENRRRGLRTIRNFGYEVIEAKEHFGQANRHERKASRQIKSAVRYVTYTQISELSEELRALRDSTLIRYNDLNMQLKQVARRQDRLERIHVSAQESQHVTNDALQEALKQLMERVDRIEKVKEPSNGYNARVNRSHTDYSAQS